MSLDYTHPPSLSLSLVEIATLTRTGEGVAARTEITVLPGEEVDRLIKEYEAQVEAKKREERAKEERAKAEKAAAAAKTA